MLQLAAQATAVGDEELAQQVLTALLTDHDLQVRNEARFRLAQFAMRDHKWLRAGTLLRAIVDEEPSAQRARLDLARVQAELGDVEASRRTLREAQAGGLPPDVARQVERFSAALRDRRRYGASVQVAIAPDSNINRATRSETLGTVLGEFQIDDSAQQTAGTGIALRTEGYFRRPLSGQVSLLAWAGLAADFYRAKQFNDIIALVSVGPEFPMAGGRANLLLGAQERWFGNQAYNRALEANFLWVGAIDRRSQMRAGLEYSRTDYRANDLQDSHDVNAFASFEHAFSSRFGVSFSLSGQRRVAEEPSYSTASGQIAATAWRDVGKIGLFATATYQHLEADRRLSIYPRRRQEDFLRLALGATFRSLGWHGWAPQLKVVREINHSSIEVYDFRRWRSEFGVTRAF